MTHGAFIKCTYLTDILSSVTNNSLQTLSVNKSHNFTVIFNKSWLNSYFPYIKSNVRVRPGTEHKKQYLRGQY